MQNSLICSVLAAFCLVAGVTLAKPTADVGDYPLPDSYAVIPKVEDGPLDTESELNLDIVPPGPLEATGPTMFYMNSDGVAVPIAPEELQKRFVKREAIPADVIDTKDDFQTDETVIIGPPSGNRPFGTPAVNLGFRPAHAYYARRYHKYPWNYH